MDSPEGATGRKKSFYFLSRISENGFPPEGQLGGRRALKEKVGFLTMDSPRRGNWAEEELKKSEISENGFPPKGQLGGRRAFQKWDF